MNIVLKDKIKIDNNFITDLISRSWQDSENIQNQINSIEVNSTQSINIVKLLKDLLTSYYVFIGCLENLENEPIEVSTPEIVQPEIVQQENSVKIPSAPTETISGADALAEFDIDTEAVESNTPFEYFVDFDEPTGEPLTDEDLYNN